MQWQDFPILNEKRKTEGSKQFPSNLVNNRINYNKMDIQMEHIKQAHLGTFQVLFWFFFVLYKSGYIYLDTNIQVIFYK